MASSAVNACPAWASNLSASGFYYDGLLDQSELEKVLELHKRDSWYLSCEYELCEHFRLTCSLLWFSFSASKTTLLSFPILFVALASLDTLTLERVPKVLTVFMMYSNQCVYMCVCVWGGGGGGG